MPVEDGTRLKAFVNDDHAGAPLVILIHGWLGHETSSYLARAALALKHSGYNVARLLLRDHGDTIGLNEDLFHSARIDEVVDACNWLAMRYGSTRVGAMGFSLGGSFAIRIAAHPRRSDSIAAALAVCPVIDPAPAAYAIDNGFIGYRWYFLSKWRRALRAKQAAFPDRYDFGDALRLPTVSELTEEFARRYTPFADAAEYYAAYRIDAARLAPLAIPVSVVVAEDDPVIPYSSVATLPVHDCINVFTSPLGGHCAFLDAPTRSDAIGRHAMQFFDQHLS